MIRPAFMLFMPWVVCISSLYGLRAIQAACKGFVVLSGGAPTLAGTSMLTMLKKLYT